MFGVQLTSRAAIWRVNLELDLGTVLTSFGTLKYYIIRTARPMKPGIGELHFQQK